MVNELKHKNSELVIINDGQLKEQKGEMALEIERLKQSHAQALSEAKESHLVAQAKLKAEVEGSLNASKDFEVNSYKKTIAELEKRVHDKEEEIKSAKHMMDNEGIHAQHITAESLRLREEVSEYKGSLETFRLESIINKDEMSAVRSQMEAVQNEYRNLVRVDQDNKEQIKSLGAELAGSKSAHASAVASLESAQVMIKEYENSAVLHSHESQRVMSENSDYKKDLQEMSSVCRENERLKLAQMQLQGEHRDLCRVRTDLETQLAAAEEDCAKLQKQLDEVSTQARDGEEVSRAVRLSREQLQSANAELDQKNSRLEAVLEEQRALLNQCQADLRTERSSRQGMESQFGLGEKQLMDTLSRLRGGCETALTAMSQWEEVLSSVLEPVLFNQTGTELSYNNPPGGSSDDMALVQGISSQVSVVNKIMSRVQRIRQIFQNHLKDAVAASQAKVDTAMDRVLVTNQKLNTMENQYEQLRGVFDRDRKIREEETKDMKNLKEHVFLECGDKIREAEMKFLTLKSQHDQELFVFNQTNAANTLMKEEIVAFKGTIQKMEEKISRFSEMEVEFAQCKLNLANYMENNKLISYELEDRGKHCQRVSDELDRVTEERNQVIEAAERLRMQVTNRDVVISKYEAELSSLSEENKVLRSKQMDPKLAAMIKQSQSLMSSTSTGVAASSGAPASVRAPSPSPQIQQLNSSRAPVHSFEEPERRAAALAVEVPSTPVVDSHQQQHQESQQQSSYQSQSHQQHDSEAPTNGASVTINSQQADYINRNHSALRFSVQELAGSNSASQQVLVPSPPKQAPGAPQTSTVSYGHGVAVSPYVQSNATGSIARDLNFNYNAAASGTPYGASTRPPIAAMPLPNADGSLTPRSRLDHLASNMSNLTQKLDSYGAHPASAVASRTPGAGSGNSHQYSGYNHILQSGSRDMRDSRDDHRDSTRDPQHHQQGSGYQFSQSQYARSEPRGLAPDDRYIPPSNSHYTNQSSSRINSSTSSPTQPNGYGNRSDTAPVNTQSPFLHFNYSSGLAQTQGSTRYTKL